MHRGVGNPCPLVLVGLPASVITFGENLDVAADRGRRRSGVDSMSVRHIGLRTKQEQGISGKKPASGMR